MKHIALCIVICFVGQVSCLYGQCLQNGDFAQFTCTYPICPVFENGCVPNWSVSHGSPQVFGTNGAAANYALMWSNGEGHEGMFASYNFIANRVYSVSLRVSAGSTPTTPGGFKLLAANGLTDKASLYCGGGGAIQANSTNQLIVQQAFTSNQPGWSVFTYSFTPTSNYSQFWMYPVTPLGPQYIWYVDYVTICPDSCNSTIYYNNNDILPVGDSKYGYIYAGSTAGSGTSGLVTVSPTGTSNLIAAHEIQLLPEFEAIVTTGGFIASIRPCDTSGGETRLNHEINKAADRNIPVPLFRDYPDPPINNITDNSNARVQGQVAIYPNPAKDKLQGRLIGNDEKTVTIKILDCYGKLMKTTTLNNINKGSQNFEINISDLPAGLYFIHISGKRSSVVKKFEKIK